MPIIEKNERIPFWLFQGKLYAWGAPAYIGRSLIRIALIAHARATGIDYRGYEGPVPEELADRIFDLELAMSESASTVGVLRKRSA